VDNLVTILLVAFPLGMMILLVKYAKFIHKQPRMEEERRQNSNKENRPPGEQT
jgi:hypothetical protein